MPPPVKKAWYANVYVMLVALVSTIAVAMVGFLLLLLPRSSEIVRVMQWRMVTARSFHMDATVDYQGTKEEKDEHGFSSSRREKVVLETDGRYDRSPGDAERSATVFRLEAGAQDPIVAAGEVRKAGEASLLNFSTLPARIGTLHFEQFRNRWLRVDLRPLLESIDLPLIGGESVELGPEERAYLLEQLRITPFVSVENKLKGETLDGIPTHHYEVRPEVLFFKDYYILYERLRKGGELTQKQRQWIDAFFANVTAEPGELWIGTRDYYLYRIRLRFRYDDGQREGVFSFTADFSRFNEPILVDIPTKEVEDVNSLVESLLPGLSQHLPLAKLGEVRRVKRDDEGAGLPIDVPLTGEEDPDEDGLINSLERFYGSDPQNPDTDGDGVSDGDEIAKGDSPTGAGRLFDFFGGQFE
jgi:hypothetical protein